MRRLKQFVALAFVVLLLVACARQSQEMTAYNEAPSGAGAPRESVSQEGAATGDFDAADDAATQDVQEQLIIRTGTIEIVVENSEETIDAIGAQVNAAGGWVVSSNLSRRGEAKAGNITVRVPVQQFEAMMNEIEAMAVEVLDSSTTGQDVTEEYVDRRARLENLEATAARVRSFLEDAQDVEDALAVNAELSRLEGEIEAIRGRLQYLEQSAAFSTITVHITPDALAQPIEIGGWRASGVVRDALSALISAVQGLATILIWIVVVLLPLALIVLGPLALIYFLVSRRRRVTTAAAAENDGA